MVHGADAASLSMSVSIRSRLLFLVLAVLLPGLAGLAYLMHSVYAGEREANTRTLRDTSRALSMVVEGELRKRAAIAQVLAASRWLDHAPHLAPEEKARFTQLATRAVQGMEGWVELRSSMGVVLDTRQPNAEATPQDPDEALELLDLRVVEPLRIGASPEQAHAGVVEPVQREGRTVLNLAITIRPAELQRIVDAQKLPDDWVAAVLDNRGRIVARVPGGADFVGREAAADLRDRMAMQREGLFRSVSLAGKPIVGYFSTTAQGWTYLTAMPPAQFSGLLPGSVQQVVLGALALLGIAIAGAFWLSRRIVDPVNALKAAAAQLQTGQTVAYRPTGIAECDEVACALSRACETIQRARTDLESQVAQAVARTRLAEQRASKGQRIEALGPLTGGVAHDFNNLLGVVSNSAHLIERHPAVRDLELPLRSIQRAVAAGSQLTQHLLRFAGRRQVQPRPVNLARYLPEVCELMRSVLGRRIGVSVQVAADTHEVRVDIGELELALINLALNARDAMPAGGELRLRARNAGSDETQGLAGAAASGYVMLSVADDGSGMEPAVAARAFEPFHTTKPVGQGTGLGLSQVLGFCTQAGGTARLASTPGLGTTVVMLLPAGEGAVDPGAAAAAAGAPRAFDGVHVLVVEDNEELARITVALLRSRGFVVRHAADAAAALRQLQPPHPIQLVLSDVVMPGEMTGLMLARRLRREQPGLAVVLVSGYSDAAAEATDFVVLRKPCAENELLQALAKALG